MKHVHHAARQSNVFAVWQLREDGWSEKRIRTARRDCRRLLDGVYLTGHAPPTPRQWLIAAALTALSRHRGARGTASLRATVDRYARLQLHRCRSDAEARAMEVLDEAGVALGEVNVRIAGFEADLVLPEQRRIIDIDGDAFHIDKALDARKTTAWRRAGWTVDRIGSDDVFDHPERLVALARRPRPRS